MKWFFFVFLLTEVSIDNVDLKSDDGEHFLALRETKGDGEGTAWYVNADGVPVEAFEGKYESDGSQAVSALRLNFAHRWERVADGFGQPCWRYDSEYHTRDDLRYGVFVEYEKRGTSFDVSVVRPHAVDRDGDYETELWKITDAAHLRPGAVINFAPGTLDDVEVLPPPGFVPRAEWKNHANEEPNTIRRADLVQEDWYGWTASGSAYVVLSLEEGARWDSGSARLLIAEGVNCTVGRGNYELYLDKNRDAINIELPLTRYYKAYLGGGKLEWQVRDTSRMPTGLTLTVPLCDRCLDDELLTACVQSTYFVSEDGSQEKRYSDPGGLFRSAVERGVNESLGLYRGCTILFKPGRLFAANPASWEEERSILAAISASPPPGYRLRPTKTLQVVGKTVLNSDELTGTSAAETLRKHAAIAYQNRDFKEAAALYTRVILNGDATGADFSNRAYCYRELEEYVLALSDYSRAIEIEPTAERHYWRGTTFDLLDQYQAAINDYKSAYRLDPKHQPTLNVAAWLWATCPDATARDGRRAVIAAKKLCTLSNWKNHNHLDTLAAAYAEAGDFTNAVRYEEMARDMVFGEVRVSYCKRLEKYQARKPHRQGE